MDTAKICFSDRRTAYFYGDDWGLYQQLRHNSLTGCLKYYNIPGIVYMSVNFLFWCFHLLFRETLQRSQLPVL